jgi:predicted flap endonuclease-1-like 5' DNA nuclease
VIGASYALSEVIWWLLAAAAIGFAVGWILRKVFLGKTLEAEFKELRTEEEQRRGELQLELENWKSKAAGFSSDLDSRTADVEQLQSKLADHESAAAEKVTKLEAQMGDRESTIDSLRGELDRAKGKVSSLGADVVGAEETLGSLRADLDAKSNENTALAAKADELAAVSASLTASRETEEQLQARIAQLESGATDAANAESRIGDLEAKLSAALADRDSNTVRLSEAEARHAECADRFDADAATIAGLEAQLAAAPSTDDLPDKDVALTKVAEIATRTRGTGPSVDDDLKKIHGVGPKLERLLKSMDITSFRQVAHFTTDDIQYVTAALEAFPGRIERDDWMTSAADEHSKKYGERA